MSLQKCSPGPVRFLLCSPKGAAQAAALLAFLAIAVLPTAPAQAGEWSEWQTVQGDDSAGGVDISFRWASFEYEGGNYQVSCRFRNRYATPVKFEIDIFTSQANGAKSPTWWISADLPAGEKPVSNGGWYTIAKKIEGYRVKKLKGPGSKENANRGVSEIDFTKSDAGSIEKREARRREQASRAESQRIEAMRQEQERREEQQRQQERLEAQRRALEVSEAQRIERERVAQERLEEQRLRQQEAEQRRFDQQRRRILQDAQRAQRSLQGQANSVNDALEKMKEMLMQQNEDRTDPSEAPETTEEGE